MAESKKILTVTEVTKQIKYLLESELGVVWIEGEISNLRRPVSGHLYFTIKDENSQISAVMFKGNQTKLNFSLKDGLKVRVFGQISVYERGGNYQIIVKVAEESGKGNLQIKFEELKEKLRKEGLFDEARKKQIPMLPQHIGVVTSPTGAAIRDILNVINRRFPNLHVVIAPVKVQGDGAAEEIAEAIDLFNKIGGIDVMIVGRGGGSLEDLWAFNEEVVARALSRSGIPTISAVGHEIDFTISDFVADLRAPTPSAAAELVVGRKDEFIGNLARISKNISGALKGALLEYRGRFNAVKTSYVFHEPGNLVRNIRSQLANLQLGMNHALKGIVTEARQMIDDSVLKIEHCVKISHQRFEHDLKRLSAQLAVMNPTAVLSRGYSITRDSKGRIIYSSETVKAGEEIKTILGKGGIDSKVLNITK